MKDESIKLAGVRFTADDVEVVRLRRGGFDIDIRRKPKRKPTTFLGFRAKLYEPADDEEDE